MTLKFQDLETFCANLLDNRKGNREIGLHTLEHEVAKRFGFSDYKMKNVMSALYKYGFIERLGMADRYKILYLEKKKDDGKEAKKEVDALLKNISASSGKNEDTL